MSIDFKFKDETLLIYVDANLADRIDKKNYSAPTYIADTGSSIDLINHMEDLSADEFPNDLQIEGPFSNDIFGSVEWVKLTKINDLLKVVYHVDIEYKEWDGSITIPEFASKFIKKLNENGYTSSESEEVESGLTILSENTLVTNSIASELEINIIKIKKLYESTKNEFTGIVYVLTNPAMPGIVKIGKTARDSVELRLNELYSTGVPVPFECAFAGRVSDESKIEKAFHLAFGPYRLNPKREFFEIEPEQAIALLELMIVEDVTPSLQDEANKIDTQAKAGSDKLKARRPVQNFIEMGLIEGSILQFSQSEEFCTVLNSRRVSYKGEDISLTALTKRLLDTDRPLQPSPYWLSDGRKLSDIYNETYE